MADQADQQVAVIEAVSGLLPRPSASFIMCSHYWRGTRVISRRSAMRAKPAAYYFVTYEQTWEKFIALGKRDSLEENSGPRSNIPQNLKFSWGRVRLSWKHMDTLYETLLHASTLIRNFIERKRASPKLIAPKIWSRRRDLSNINQNRIASRHLIIDFYNISTNKLYRYLVKLKSQKQLGHLPKHIIAKRSYQLSDYKFNLVKFTWTD